MLSAAVAQRLKVVKPLRRPKAVRKVLPPVLAAAGAVEEIAAPAVFRPIGLSVVSNTGILFPVFFWATANRVGTLHKTEASQIPAIPEAAIPVPGLAPFPTLKSEVFTLRSIFARPMSSTLLSVVSWVDDSTITRIKTEGRLLDDASQQRPVGSVAR